MRLSEVGEEEKKKPWAPAISKVVISQGRSIMLPPIFSYVLRTLDTKERRPKDGRQVCTIILVRGGKQQRAWDDDEKPKALCRKSKARFPTPRHPSS